MAMEYSVRFAIVQSNQYYSYVIVDGLEYIVPFGVTDGTRVSVLFSSHLDNGYEVAVDDSLWSGTVDLPVAS